MKVSIPKCRDEQFTVAEMKIAKRLVKMEKDDSFKAKDYLELACDKLFPSWYHVISAEAEVEKNFRDGCFDRIDDENEKIEISIKGLVRINYREIAEVDFFLADLWNVSDGDNESIREFKRNTSVMRFIAEW